MEALATRTLALRPQVTVPLARGRRRPRPPRGGDAARQGPPRRPASRVPARPRTSVHDESRPNPMRTLIGKSALVTGAASGIGLAAATRSHSQRRTSRPGHHVALDGVSHGSRWTDRPTGARVTEASEHCSALIAGLGPVPRVGHPGQAEGRDRSNRRHPVRTWTVQMRTRDLTRPALAGECPLRPGADRPRGVTTTIEVEPRRPHASRTCPRA